MEANHKPQLSSLPPELLIHILTYLPAQQTQCARRINQHFNQLITSHEASITALSISQSRARLQTRFSSLVNLTNIPVFTALCNYLTYYGLPADDNQCGQVAYTFAKQYDACNRGESGPRRLRCYLGLAYYLVAFYRTAHDPTHDGAARIVKEAGEHFFASWNPAVTGVPLKELQAMVRTCRETDCFEAGPGYFARRGVPKWFLTTIIGSVEGARKGMEVAEVLGIPALPETELAYCVKTERMCKVIGDAKATREMGLLMKAAVLEELFIW